MAELLKTDIEHVLTHVAAVWPRLADQTILLTGGTGFFGKWLLESWVAARRVHAGRGQLWLVTRNPSLLLKNLPHLARTEGLHFVIGDVRDFVIPSGLNLDFVLHAATPAFATQEPGFPLEILDTAVCGTRHVLDIALQHGRPKVLFVSSGAVYGRYFDTSQKILETYNGSPDPLNVTSTYGEGKRQAEHLCKLYEQAHSLLFTVARCFAFIGPHLALDGPFAIGNFIRDARGGGPICVRDGSSWRSYLYAADLTIWLWNLLVCGQPGMAYNVGSDDALQIGQLAEQVADFYGCAIEFQNPAGGHKGSYYVPSVDRARVDLGLRVRVDFHDALRRTENFLAQPHG